MDNKKITVFKKVSWVHAGRKYSGTVRLVMGNHVVVKGKDGGEYIVQKKELEVDKQ